MKRFSLHRNAATIGLSMLVFLGLGCRDVDPAMETEDMATQEEPAQGVNALTPEERAQGWISLFDGNSLDQWKGYQRDDLPAGWVVEDRSIHFVGEGEGDLLTREQYADFELKLEWKISPGGNSGVFFRVSEDEDGTWKTGPEMQVLDNALHPNGELPETSAGANYGLHAPSKVAVKPVGEWNEVHIIVNGPHVEHWLNGEQIVAYDLWTEEWEALVAQTKFAETPRYGRNEAGYLALQDHGDPVWFRALKVKSLD